MSELLVTFSRRFDRPVEATLAALERWGPQSTQRFAGGPSTADASHSGAARYQMAVRIGRLRRSIPIELRIAPWSATEGTEIELLPSRRVRPTPRYFARCRALLNDLSAEIARSGLAGTAAEGGLSRSA
jgi:hypothetical protein